MTNNRTYQTLLQQVKTNPDLLEDMQLENSGLSEAEIHQLFLTAVQQDGFALRYVPEDKRDSDICLAAVTKDGFALKYVPEDKRDRDICYVAVTKIGIALEYVPEDKRDRDICHAAITQDGVALQYVPEGKRDHDICLTAVTQFGLALQYVPEDKRDRDICLAAVTQNGLALQYIPEDKRDREICLVALKQRGEALEYVPEIQQNHEIYLAAVTQNAWALNLVPKDKRNHEIYLAAVNQNGKALKSVPKDKRDHDICLAAVTQLGLTLEYVPEDKRDRDICFAAVKQNGLALQYVPKDKLDHDICLAAVRQNGTALQYVPEDKKDRDICLAAVTHNGIALQYVPEDKKERDICLAAVTHNGFALQYVPEDIKSFVIDTLSLERILSDQYEAHQYIPATHDNKIKMNQFLSQIQHVVITNNKELLTDHELKDIYLVYANSPNRAGKIVHIDKENAESLFENLKTSQNRQNINLALLGHANEYCDTLADMSIPEITGLLRENDDINRVTLLSCNTAKSLKLDQEKVMISRFLEKEKIRTTMGQSYCGMILMSREPNLSDYPKLLDKIKKDKDGKDLDRAYILSKTIVDGKDHYRLTYIQKNPNNINEVIAQNFLLDQEGINKLQNKMTRGKAFAFSKNASIPIYFRGGAAQCLKKDEVDEITTAIENAGKFDKKHPAYKQTKQDYPFLSNVTIDETEAFKLQKSLLKLMVKSIQDNVPLTRDITVKGYAKFLHVDTKEQRMHVTRTHLYSTKYQSSLFYAKQDIIDRKKLADERKSTIREMEKGEEASEMTTVKSIKVNIRKKS